MKHPFILALALLLCSVSTIAQVPVNDLCANATTLTLAPDCSPTAGSLYNTTNTTTTGTGNCGSKADVWYRVTVPALTRSMSITVTLTSTNTPLTTSNTYIEMLNNNSCPTAGTHSGGCNNISSPRTYPVNASTTYMFRIYTTNNITSSPANAYNFNVCVTANDNCTTASTVPPGSTLDGSLRGASATTGIPTGCTGAPDDDVWYKFNPVLDYATISLSNIGADLNSAGPRMQLFRGTCASLTSVACGSTTINVTGLSTTETYYCRVYSNSTGQSGTNYGFRFSVMPSALTRVTGSRMNEVYNQQIISSPQLLADPWEVTYGPDNHLWITESKGYKVYRVNPVTGTRDTILDISQNSTTSPDVNFRCQFNNGSGAQGGLAGMALHPKFLDATAPQNYVYLSYVYSMTSSTVFTNRLVRFEYDPATKKLLSPVSLCDTLPGSSDHNSQRMIIAPVGGVDYLFYAEGDMGAGQFGNATRTQNAQNIFSYEGKILRFNLEPDGDAGARDQWIPSTGSGHATNPYNATVGRQHAVWAIGIRNNQGFVYDPILNKLYGSSHGPFSDDEINVIERGKNYGHPIVIGYADGNANGTTAGASPGMNPAYPSSCPDIVDEVVTAASLPNYKEPLFSAYPNSLVFPTLKGLWDQMPVSNNGIWPSEGWSGLDFYTNTVIPGWKRSLVASSLKWGRLVRIRLDKTGDSAAYKSRANNTFKQDTVSYFGSINRFRDLAFAPNGKDIYVIMDRSTSTSGPSALYPVVPACQGCLQKYSFLGYEDLAGQSSIDTSIDVTDGIVNTCNTGTTVIIDDSNKSLWVPITGPDGNIMAEIFPNNQNLGTVTSSFYKNSGALRTRNGSSYADRNVTITPQNPPSGMVKVRIYLSKKEYQDFDANALSGITGLSDLRIHKNSDPCQNAIAAATSIINPTFKVEHGDSAYVLQADILGFSTFYIGSTNVLLPLTSLNFNGKYKDDISYLNWETSNESNTDHFEVERNTGEGTYTSIGTVEAKGNGSGKTRYTLNDNEASKLGTSRLYYRLKITDKDGSYTYSNVVVVDIPGTFITRISIFPNPADKQTTVLISSPEEQKITWQLVDVTGRSVIAKDAVLKKGENRIVIDLNNLRTGVYFLQVKGQFVNAQEKIQKL
ncbi:PQQ-dependent sugar dehydrogenase [Flavitalea sp.]|nr:PQQ-dependent sugar dehydrogenase [Flavitalea sp.]